MSGPWENYAPQEGPWTNYAQDKAKPNVAKDLVKSAASGLAASGDPFVGMFGDMADLGWRTGNALLQFATGQQPSSGGAPRIPGVTPPTTRQVGAARQAVTGQPDYQPQTLAGKYAFTVGQFAPNALIAPGTAGERALAVVLPALGSETAGQVAEMSGAGAFGQTAARVAGGMVGGLGASYRPQPRGGPLRDPALDVLTRRQDPQEMTARAAELRVAGVDPTLVDVVDDSGRGVVRAAASRMTPGRQAATDFRDARALDMPSRMSEQARRVMSDDPRTPDQIRDAMSRERSANADAAFSAVRSESIAMAPETVQALRNPLGRAAITEAANRERDPEVRAALNRLATAALDDPSTGITIGMADRISRTLLGRAQAAARSGDNDLATTYSQLGRAIRDPARQASGGYDAALQGYEADSRLVDAAGVGEGLLRRNTDEFVNQAADLSDDERNLALAAGRRAIERASGENPASAPRIARQIAEAPEQRSRNAALMGPDRAQQLEAGMRAEERLVRNANDIAPRVGSQTFLRGQDVAETAGAMARVGQQVLRRDWLGIGMDWLRSRGMNDAQAQRVVELATDPEMVNVAVQYVRDRYGPRAAQQFLDLRRAAITAPAAVLIGGSAPRTSEDRQ